MLCLLQRPVEQPADEPQRKHVLAPHNRLVVEARIGQRILDHLRDGHRHNLGMRQPGLLNGVVGLEGRLLQIAGPETVRVDNYYSASLHMTGISL